jgi:hypothetical protein
MIDHRPDGAGRSPARSFGPSKEWDTVGTVVEVAARLLGSCRAPAARKRTQPGLEELERRDLPAGPSAYETYAWYLINQLREDPAGFAGQYLQQYRTATPGTLAMDLKEAVDYYEQTTSWRSGFNGAASGSFLDAIGHEPATLPPLAFDTGLAAAAAAHDQWMLAHHYWAHSVPHDAANPLKAASWGQAQAQQIMKDLGLPENQLSFRDPQTTENIGRGGGLNNVPGDDVASKVAADIAAYVLDWGNPDLGHLTNLLTPGPGAGGSGFRVNEIGVAMQFGVPRTTGVNGQTYEDWVSTHRIGQRPADAAGSAFVTGVVYEDANGNGGYDPGEGLGGAVVTAKPHGGAGAAASVQSWDAGGYSLWVKPGTYDVTIRFGGQTLASKTVAVGQDNVRLDGVAEVPQAQRVLVPAPVPATTAAPAAAAADQPVVAPVKAASVRRKPRKVKHPSRVRVKARPKPRGGVAGWL